MLPSERTTRRRLKREIPSHIDSVDLSHGVTVGDVTDETAVVWTRTAEPAVVHVEYTAGDSFRNAERATPQKTREAGDNTAKIRLTGLESGTEYRYRVWALTGKGATELFEPPETTTGGRFTTAPAEDSDAPVSLVWSGDTYGQGRAPPYQVPKQMANVDPDLFLYLGDTIYADSESPAVPDGNPQTVDDYRAKYKEVRERGDNIRNLLSQTSVVSIWDDHEVENDWGGEDHPLLPAGRQAFFEYWPIDEHHSVTGEDDNRLYRSFRWGDDVELFVLDTRQYRDDNTKADGPEKTMLGTEQKQWLKESLADCDATFALIASGPPLSTKSSAPEARDSWANAGAETGFENELEEITSHIQEDVESTVVWLTGDRHYARVVSLDPDRDGTPEMYEAMAGPLGAFPRDPGTPDRTLAPTVYYQEGGKYEHGEFYNFGHIEVDGTNLDISIHDKMGERRCTMRIDADGENWPTVETAPESEEASTSELLDGLKKHIERLTERWR